MVEEKDVCLSRLRSVFKDKERLDDKTVKLIGQLDVLLEKKKQIENKLEQIRVKTDQIQPTYSTH